MKRWNASTFDCTVSIQNGTTPFPRGEFGYKVNFIMRRALKLAKLILFADILHFNKMGVSITGMYYVRLKNGPVVAFFDEVLEQHKGILWDIVTKDIPIYSEGVMKKQYLYTALTKKEPPKEVKQTIEQVVKKYGSKTGT